MHIEETGKTPFEFSDQDQSIPRLLMRNSTRGLLRSCGEMRLAQISQEMSTATVDASKICPPFQSGDDSEIATARSHCHGTATSAS